MENISITRNSEDRIQRHALESYPEECCGLLLGIKEHDGSLTVRDSIRENNRYGRRLNAHYAIDPISLSKHEREIRKQGLEIIGFYHSHPDHPAILSREDDKGMIPGQVYMIIPAYFGQCRAMGAWMKNTVDDRPREMSVEIKEH